jgi:hypothetical protein
LGLVVLLVKPRPVQDVECARKEQVVVDRIPREPTNSEEQVIPRWDEAIHAEEETYYEHRHTKMKLTLPSVPAMPQWSHDYGRIGLGLLGTLVSLIFLPVEWAWIPSAFVAWTVESFWCGRHQPAGLTYDNAGDFVYAQFGVPLTRMFILIEHPSFLNIVVLVVTFALVLGLTEYFWPWRSPGPGDTKPMKYLINFGDPE